MGNVAQFRKANRCVDEIAQYDLAGCAILAAFARVRGLTSLWSLRLRVISTLPFRSTFKGAIMPTRGEHVRH